MTIAKVTQQAVETLYASDTTSNVRVTQQSVETLYESDTTSNVRVTQQSVEVLFTAADLNSRLSTLYGETLHQRINSAWLTAAYSEVLQTPIPDAAFTTGYGELLWERINYVNSTQQYGEVLHSNYTSIYPAFITQEYADILAQRLNIPCRVTHTYSEVIAAHNTEGRTSMSYAEVIHIPINTYGSITTLFAEVLSGIQKNSANIIQITVN